MAITINVNLNYPTSDNAQRYELIERVMLSVQDRLEKLMDQTAQIRIELAELRDSQTAVAVGVASLVANNSEVKAKVEELKTLLIDSIDSEEAAGLIAEIDELTTENQRIAASITPPVDEEGGGEIDPLEGDGGLEDDLDDEEEGEDEEPQG